MFINSDSLRLVSIMHFATYGKIKGLRFAYIYLLPAKRVSVLFLQNEDQKRSLSYSYLVTLFGSFIFPRFTFHTYN